MDQKAYKLTWEDKSLAYDKDYNEYFSSYYNPVGRLLIPKSVGKLFCFSSIEFVYDYVSLSFPDTLHLKVLYGTAFNIELQQVVCLHIGDYKKFWNGEPVLTFESPKGTMICNSFKVEKICQYINGEII